ncbi:MAG: hypothetical protein H6825_14505 [Planctomycetes bacterium]|nr:hypothetical protein [Planctomycetota bacterium]
MSIDSRRVRRALPPFAAGLVCALLVLAARSAFVPGERLTANDLDPVVQHRDEVVQLVDGVEVRASDVYRMLELAAPQVTSEIMGQVVLATLAQLEAAAEGVDVPADQVELLVAKEKQRVRDQLSVQGGGKVDLAEFLREQHGMTVSQYDAEVRRMVLAQMLADRVVRLDQMRQARDELQLILVDDAALAAEIAAKLHDGASFSALARQHSIHPTAASGGFLPPFPVGIPAALVDGRDALQPGEFLGPAPVTIDGHDAFRLLRLVRRLPARTEPWDVLRQEIEQELSERPVGAEELIVFEARMRDRYRVQRPPRSP